MSDASVTLLREHTAAAERNCCATSSLNFGKTSEASLLVCYNTTPTNNSISTHLALPTFMLLLLPFVADAAECNCCGKKMLACLLCIAGMRFWSCIAAAGQVQPTCYSRVCSPRHHHFGAQSI